MLWAVLLIVLIVLVIGALPRWPHMDRFDLGYQPSGWLFLLLVVVLILVFGGRI